MFMINKNAIVHAFLSCTVWTIVICNILVCFKYNVVHILRQCVLTDGPEFLTTKQVEQEVGEGFLGKCQNSVKERGRGDSCNTQGG